ncbi:hypothetical protein [Pseudobacteriovorax antillogorgiicola]|uniref:Uncharacterized protein n=1 Tax=Pseudobacteriovorax antillogorgiicola TaxID=1513793 RepID=A0A1Y6B8D3_9BACT|nr:hypothetical protein [Pseudobacteriovorax antillogorgiicola]TCS59189.1 hypothetical protein EDD56_10192 [Pseudobacteriovorax antillogorgiicola]SME90771.1 hypothetical protein SAMN06296036_101394 [Pseudobacteriovorax antillogorgiicola]
MKRVFEFIPTDHDIIVSRTLVMVHQAIDAAFPNAAPASQRFAKTAFGGDEPTLTQGVGGGEWAQINMEDTAPKKKLYVSEESVLPEDEPTLSKELFQQKLWKQSLIGIITIAICALIVYFVIG